MQCRPMNPDAPVTRTLVSEGLCVVIGSRCYTRSVRNGSRPEIRSLKAKSSQLLVDLGVSEADKLAASLSQSIRNWDGEGVGPHRDH